MTKHATLALSLILVALLCTTATANFIDMIVDVYPDDLNEIVRNRVTFNGAELFVPEDYNETDLIAYPSHDGYAIVNPDGQFFDKIITLPIQPPGIPILTFEVLNTTPYTWSDYHFEFWDPEFLQPLRNVPLLFAGPTGTTLAAESDVFTNVSFDGHSLNFWAPGSVAPGATVILSFALDFRGPVLPQEVTFGLRQIATTTPEPGTAYLVGLGVLCAGWLVRRRRKI